jgi:hypothetical protein
MGVAPVNANVQLDSTVAPQQDGVQTDVSTDGTVQIGHGPTVIADAKPKTLEGPSDGYEKGQGGSRPTFDEVPPNLSGPEAQRFQQGAALAEAMGPGGQEALGDLVQDFKDGKIPDAESLFSTMETMLQEHGVAVPPGGFDQLEAKSAEGSQAQAGEPTLQAQSSHSKGSLEAAEAQGKGPTWGSVKDPILKPGTFVPGGRTLSDKIQKESAKPQHIQGEGAQRLAGDTGQFATVIKSTNWAVLGCLNGGDIEALAFLVLMEASKSAQEDLKAIMAGVKSINNAKKAQREILSKMQALSSTFAGVTSSQSLSGKKGSDNKDWNGATFDKAIVTPNDQKNPDGYVLASGYILPKECTKQQLDTAIDTCKSDLDSMSEMGEMESLRLQMAMDRMSKMMSTLSNMLKKISDTASQITQNLK